MLRKRKPTLRRQKKMSGGQRRGGITKRRAQEELASPPVIKVVRPRTGGKRRKQKKGNAKPDWTKPHPDFPDVSAEPIDWRPGKRGRPPLGAKRRKDGSWIIPEGYRVVRGKVHPPLPAPKPIRFYLEQLHPAKLNERIRSAQREKVPTPTEVKEAMEAEKSPSEPLRILDGEGEARPGAASENYTAAPDQPKEDHQGK